MISRLALFALVALLGSASTLADALCEFKAFKISVDFEGGAAAACEQSGKAAVLLTIKPENTPINNSPWYAFKVESERLGRVDVKLEYQDGTHRYTPKLSSDGVKWIEYPADRLIVGDDKSYTAFSVPIKGGVTWVAAQPLLGLEAYQQWWSPLTRDSALEYSVIGESLERRDLPRLIALDEQEELLIILGRQHPPETTGAVAMMAFVDRLFAGDELSNRFLKRVGVVIYPFINRDGVQHGHWRHNLDGTDLNRDWGPFEQPEPRQVNQDITGLVTAHNLKPGYMLDFHSTWYDVFYTQKDSDYILRSEITGAWLGAFEQSMREIEPDFKLNRKSSHNPNSPTSKSYFFETYGIPATTYEIGDDAPITRIQEYARRSAVTFMQSWLNEAPWYE
jgi:hypothetical protein